MDIAKIVCKFDCNKMKCHAIISLRWYTEKSSEYQKAVEIVENNYTVYWYEEKDHRILES